MDYVINKDTGRVTFKGKTYPLYQGPILRGERSVIDRTSCDFPEILKEIPHPPKKLYVIGSLPRQCSALAVIGARKATPYGLAATRYFSLIAAQKGITIVSGGALGCDSCASKAVLELDDKAAQTIVFLGGGCDQIYPASNYSLFQDIINKGGAVVSEQDWTFPALPYTFRERNRLIAGYAQATLIVEAGLPSGTFSTADEALTAGRDVLVVPGAITSKTSLGSNMLLYQGATPVIDKSSFEDALFSIYGVLKQQDATSVNTVRGKQDTFLEALLAEPLRLDDILRKVKVPSSEKNPESWIRKKIIEYESAGVIARFPDGRYGPCRIE